MESQPKTKVWPTASPSRRGQSTEVHSITGDATCEMVTLVRDTVGQWDVAIGPMFDVNPEFLPLLFRRCRTRQSIARLPLTGGRSLEVEFPAFRARWV
jgi:hypothetical protein